MNNCFIILAAGESKRFNSKIAKPYHLYKGKPLIQHSIDKAKHFGLEDLDGFFTLGTDN